MPACARPAPDRAGDEIRSCSGGGPGFRVLSNDVCDDRCARSRCAFRWCAQLGAAPELSFFGSDFLEPDFLASGFLALSPDLADPSFFFPDPDFDFAFWPDPFWPDPLWPDSLFAVPLLASFADRLLSSAPRDQTSARLRCGRLCLPLDDAGDTLGKIVEVEVLETTFSELAVDLRADSRQECLRSATALEEVVDQFLRTCPLELTGGN